MEDNWKKYVVKHNDRNIKEVLGDVLGKNKRLSKGYATVRVQDAWKQEMGDMINGYTKKIYFRAGKLYVSLTSAPLRQELSMSKDKVMTLLNNACGEKLITSIVFN